MPRLPLLCLAIFAFGAAHAQTTPPAFDYNTAPHWLDTLKPMPSDISSAGLVCLLSEHFIRFDGEKHRYHEIHEVIRIGEEPIQHFDFPLQGNEELISLKVRAVDPSGRVYYPRDGDLADSVMRGRRYKVYTLPEALEAGSGFELDYTAKGPDIAGGTEIFQSNMPIRLARFQFRYPRIWHVSTAGFNGMRLADDTVINEEHFIAGVATDLPAVPHEPLSEPYANICQVWYDQTMAYRSSSYDTHPLEGWDAFVTVAALQFAHHDKLELHAARDFARQIGLPADAGEAQRILLVEDFVKTHVRLKPDGPKSVRDILEGFEADSSAVVGLFDALFDVLNIDHFIAAPGGRNVPDLVDDAVFPRNMRAPLFFFPGTKQCLDPTAPWLRYPFVSSESIGSRAMVVNNPPDFALIPLPPMDANHTAASLELHLDADTLRVHESIREEGYSPLRENTGGRPVPDGALDSLGRGMANDWMDIGEPRHVTVSGASMEPGSYLHPLEATWDLAVRDVVQRTGGELRVAVGRLLPARVVPDSRRHWPIDLDYPGVVDWTIRLAIPAGASLKNPDVIDRRVAVGDDVFETTHTLDNGQLLIHLREAHAAVHYTPAQAPVFCRVAAAFAAWRGTQLVFGD